VWLMSPRVRSGHRLGPAGRRVTTQGVEHEAERTPNTRNGSRRVRRTSGLSCEIVPRARAKPRWRGRSGPGPAFALLAQEVLDLAHQLVGVELFAGEGLALLAGLGVVLLLQSRRATRVTRATRASARIMTRGSYSDCPVKRLRAISLGGAAGSAVGLFVQPPR